MINTRPTGKGKKGSGFYSEKGHQEHQKKVNHRAAAKITTAQQKNNFYREKDKKGRNA